MKKIVVIDTETTWSDQVMSLGAVLADAETFLPVDSRYYLIDPYYREGGMFSSVLRLKGTPEAAVKNRKQMAADLRAWLSFHKVDTVFAYNAAFDKKHLPELREYRWCDIMRLAAYRQYNSRIPADCPCCRTGRLRSDYGVESIYRLLSGNCRYYEKHNGWYDAVDELKIMELLGLPLSVYEHAEI